MSQTFVSKPIFQPSKFIPEIILTTFLAIFYVFPVFRNQLAVYSSFTDDFYYYLKIAENFNSGNGFSFAKGIETNGYHPLYQYFICTLVFIAKITGVNVLVFIRFVFAIVFFVFSLVILHFIKPANLLSRITFSAGVCSYYFLSINGMESLMVIPLLTIFLIKINKQALSIYGVAIYAIATVLSRIDSLIVVLPVILYYCFVTKQFRRKNIASLLTAFMLAAIPFCLYVGYNFCYFGTFFPISGMAKSVDKFSGLHLETFRFFITTGKSFQIIVGLAILLSIIVYALPIRKKTMFAFFVLAGISLLYVQNSIRSDWSLWSWYLYPFPALIFLCADEAGQSAVIFQKYLYRISVLVVTCSVLVLLGYGVKRAISTGVDPKVLTALKICEFEKSNKGVFAMGDRSGIVGYLLPSPLIQLEGLVMDKTYLTRLRSAEKLNTVLLPYGTDYYVATNPVKFSDSTYIVREPRQSKGFSGRISDTINWVVLSKFYDTRQRNVGETEDQNIETVIFKVPH